MPNAFNPCCGQRVICVRSIIADYEDFPGFSLS